MSVSGTAPQFSATNGLSRRALSSWINDATSSLPVPLSPCTYTERSVGATLATSPRRSRDFLERLTDQIEAEAHDYIRRIDEMGGMIPAIERGFPQTEIANSSYAFQHSVEQGESIIVGVNKFNDETSHPPELLEIDPSVEKKQIERLCEVKRRRNASEVAKALAALRQAAESASENTMPYLVDAVRAYATVGEICATLKEVFGSYRETNVL